MTATCHVVVLNWNGREFIRECLRSVLHQTHPSYRVIVVDNASTDGSPDIIRDEFPEITFIPLPENRHFARGTNAGMREALRDPTCAFVATLNNDTRVDPDWIAELVRTAGAPVGMVASKIVFMDRPRAINSTGLSPTWDGGGVDRGWGESDEGQYDRDLDVFGVSAGAALYRREALETVGLFDGDFVAYGEDLDLAWRIRLAGWEARFSPRATVSHKYSASTSPRSAFKAYHGERNRIWTLVQNYPWRYVVAGMGWNATRMIMSQLRRRRERPDRWHADNALPDRLRATVRARLDAYAGLPRALSKRKARATYSRADPKTVGRWLRRYGVSLKRMQEA